MAEAPESFATTEGTNEPANLQGSHGSSHSRSSAEIHDRTGLYIAIIALLVAGMALGFQISKSMNESEIRRLQEANITAQIAAGAAQAERTAAEARSTAKVTEDKLSELRDALNAKGMNIPKLDGH